MPKQTFAPCVLRLSIHLAYWLLACALLAPLGAQAQQHSHLFKWQVPPDNDVAGYRLYLRVAGSAYPALGAGIDLGSHAPDAQGVASDSVGGFSDTLGYMARISAYDTSGNESGLSNELTLPAVAATCNPSACDDGNPCTIDSCSGTSCSNTPAANGLVCDDGFANTIGDACFAGVCVGTVPVSPAPQCAVNGDCSDGNACNGVEVCSAGVCSSGVAPVCSAAAQGPCMVGVCDPTLGCMATPAADGSLCDDGNSATQQDACFAGVCVGKLPQCSEDSDCSDGNACNGPEICSAGKCLSGTAPSCAAAAQGQCSVGLCDPQVGCTVAASPDGTACDDGNYRTYADACQAGICVGAVATGELSIEAEQILAGYLAPGSGTKYADVNGDGRKDALYFDADLVSTVWVGLSTGAGFAAPEPWLHHGASSADQMQYADVNGDGLADALYFDTFRSEAVWVGLSSGTGFQEPKPWLQYGVSSPDQIQYADVNGDGLADALYFDTNGGNIVWVALSTGASFAAPEPWLQHGASSPDQMQYADVNGDGLADALYFDTFRSNAVWVALSTGAGFEAPVRWLQHGESSPDQIQYADVNGDGLADALYFDTFRSNGIWVALSNSDTFGPALEWASIAPSVAPGDVFYPDLDNDGQADVVIRTSRDSLQFGLSLGGAFTDPGLRTRP